MKFFSAAAIVTTGLMAQVAQGHYIFQYLTANGEKGDQYQYIRKNTNNNSPVTDLESNDLRCNVGGLDGSSTDTVSVAAGSVVGFTADTAVYHQGPVSFYMTKVDDAKAADGSTPWFNIKNIGPTFTNGQAEWDLEQSYNVTIPECLPAGEYLLRIQQLGIHNPWPSGVPQFYISCAQVKVTGGGSGTPSPTGKIPGMFHETDPGYTANIYNQFTNYTVPGTAVWSC